MQGPVDQGWNSSASGKARNPHPPAAAESPAPAPGRVLNQHRSDTGNSSLRVPDAPLPRPTATLPQLLGHALSPADEDAFAGLANEISDSVIQMLEDEVYPETMAASTEALQPGNSDDNARRAIRTDVARIAAITSTSGQARPQGLELEQRQKGLQRTALTGCATPLTGLAMVLSALLAYESRGYDLKAAGFQPMLDFTLAGMPEESRLEALVLYRAMLTAKPLDTLVNACDAQIKKRYAQLSGQAKQTRLLKWSRMEWWKECVAGFQGHSKVLRLAAVTGMLAVLEPRLRSQNSACRIQCLVDLMENIHPVQSEVSEEAPIELAPWTACIQCWCQAAIRLEGEDLEKLMLKVLWPVSFLPPEPWPHRAAILLEAMSTLQALGTASGRDVIKPMESWFKVIFQRINTLRDERPRLAVSLCMQMLRMVGPMKETWTVALNLALRQTITLGPDRPALSAPPSESDCKTQ